ncbi:MAG: TylF/MycF family methyltransferase [Betaproteobacteria bacterium]|nr:TylF/MycF family methyltransferase [Betaproteobacteria bacterium]
MLHHVGAAEGTPHATAFNQAIEKVTSQHISVFWGDRLLTLDKSAAFLDDPKFRGAFEAVRGSHRYDEYDGKDTIAWRLHTLCWAAQNARRVDGDFVECGVFKGDMAWVVTQVLGEDNIPKFYLYDSFEGFSPEYSSNADFPESPGFIEFANEFYKQEGLYENVVRRFASNARVQVVKGFLPDALSVACPERIAYLHVDLNSPRAEVSVLERLWDRVSTGGIVVFDDYGWKLFHKQKEAEDKFMRQRGYEILELPTGQGLVVKR